MITTEDLTTTVKFGTQEKASISVQDAIKNPTHIGEGRTAFLILQQLATEKRIGDGLKQEDIQELPKVILEITSANSIDVVINALEYLKDRMNSVAANQYALAC